MEEDPPPAPPPPPRHGPSLRRWGWRLAQWTGELVTVFAGVYAAFALNAYQTHRQDRQRRQQILDWAQGYYSEALESVVRSEGLLREAKAKYERQIAAGEMPPLHAVTFSSDYNPGDITSMLQSGGFGLLEIDTIRDIRVVEGSMRQLLELAQHNQQLSDALVLPNLEKPVDFFYNPATRQLRPAYAWYADTRTSVLELFTTTHREMDKLLAQMRAERGRNR